VDAVARLHGASLTGLLTALGPRAIRAYYLGAAKAPSTRAFVAMEGGILTGFVLGAARPSDLRREIVAANRGGIFMGLAIGLVLRPKVLPWLLGSRGNTSSSSTVHSSSRSPAMGGVTEHGADRGFDPDGPELVYLAVGSNQRGSGAGRSLVEAFSTAMKDAGVRAYELSVDEANVGAIAFYERLGFRETGRYREFGAAHRRYRLELT
jgi:ribosomal protein S18 acetylase RimI-like enzyme